MPLTNRDILEFIHLHPGCTRTDLLDAFIACGDHATERMRIDLIEQGRVRVVRRVDRQYSHWGVGLLPSTPRLAGPVPRCL